jgi:hypothetical protein
MTEEFHCKEGNFLAEQSPVHTAAVAAADTDAPGPTFHPPDAPPPHPQPAPPAPVLNEPSVPGMSARSYGPAEDSLENLESHRKSVPAKRGWRAVLNSLTRINIAPGKDEAYELSLQDRVRRIVREDVPSSVELR